MLKPVIIAFSMFSRLPMPHVEWSEKNMGYALCAFPLVGLVQGLFSMGWGVLAGIWNLPPLLAGAVMTALPVLFNGGIHYDGLCDTADALASHGDAQRKREILKDPHIGAFGVMTLVCHAMLQWALFASMSQTPTRLLALLCVYVLGRGLSGFAVLAFPSVREGTANTFKENSRGKMSKVILLSTCLLTSVGLVLLEGIGGCLAAAAALLVLAYYRWRIVAQFGGVSGDLAGWFLQTAELAMLTALTVGGMLWS